MQIEAIKGVIEELLTSSGSDNPQRWAMHAIGEISQVLDMTHELEVMTMLHNQEQRRGNAT